MSWIFSKALCESLHYSPEPEGGYSEATCLDGEPFAQLNVMPTPHKFWRNDKTMEFSNLSRFGLTLRLLTEQDGETLLTLFLRDSHASHIRQQENGEELMTSDGFGMTSRESLLKQEQNLYGLKMYQESFQMGLELKYLEALPKWGSMRNGVLYPQEIAEPPILENAPGYSLPTIGKNEFRGTSKNRFFGSLDFRMAKMCEGLRICETDPTYLTPQFAEIMMGWPLGWTELAPLEMDKFQEWQQQHSLNYREG